MLNCFIEKGHHQNGQPMTFLYRTMHETYGIGLGLALRKIISSVTPYFLVNSHALPTVPVYKKNRIASLLCIFETTISTVTYPFLFHEWIVHA